MSADDVPWIPWVLMVIQIIVVLLGFFTMRREQARDAKNNLEAAIKNEKRLTTIEVDIQHILRRMGAPNRG